MRKNKNRKDGIKFKTLFLNWFLYLTGPLWIWFFLSYNLVKEKGSESTKPSFIDIVRKSILLVFSPVMFWPILIYFEWRNLKDVFITGKVYLLA